MIKFCSKCQSETHRYPDGKCKPCTIARRRKYDYSKADAARYLKNKEKISKYRKLYESANKEKIAARKVLYRAKNPQRFRVARQNRRARSNGGVLSKGLPAKLFKLQKGKCPCCNKPLGENFHLDHIMPLVLGGSNTDDNIQLLRATCNLQKSAAHPIDFMQQRGFLI